MKGAFIAATASLLLAPAAIAQPEINPQGGIEREAYAFRQCREFGGEWGKYVCYNTTNRSWFTLAGVLPTPFSRIKSRTHMVNCERSHPGNSLRSQVAAEYCPQLPELAPAQFLSLND